MFTNTFVGNTAAVTVTFHPDTLLFVAVVSKEGKVKQLSDHDLNVLFKQLRGEVSDKIAVIAVKRFVSTMGQSIRMLVQLRKSFLISSKSEIEKIRATLKKKSKSTVKVLVPAAATDTSGKKVKAKLIVKKKK